ncbi:hypothetical protein [Algisphaera agarilytica]|uniref:Peptidase family M50 n=1 Tax=Algisphaera agarilytica TaxID=1385975 RepID=A0A7X0H3L8_9BACT|nr:hypothetical protein [Algisphaera agarilytica]MBB6428667.1 hypothetical protein [Algisphaera agarilytica]
MSDSNKMTVHQIALAIAMLGLSWVGMMVVHELGHVIGGMLTGGTVQRVVLPVLGFSRTDVKPNPSPGIVVWAGPVIGVLLPLAMWGLSRLPKLSYFEPAMRFFAGFCLVANGAYIALGTFERVGDVDVMLSTGTPEWVLWLFGAITAPFGFFMWHGLGARFGLSRLRSHWLAWILLAVTVALCFVDIEIELHH